MTTDQNLLAKLEIIYRGLRALAETAEELAENLKTSITPKPVVEVKPKLSKPQQKILKEIELADQAETNFSINDWQKKYKDKRFKKTIHELLLRGEIFEVENKVYPIGTKNI